MPKSGTTKTVVECAPGQLATVQAAFAGMEVRVVDTLDVAYRFVQEEMTGMDLVMAELEAEERVAADPKRAHTFVVPLLTGETSDLTAQELLDCSYLLVRTQDDIGYHVVLGVIGNTKIQTNFTGEVEVTATISELRQKLKDEGVNVLSISEAEGITRLTV